MPRSVLTTIEEAVDSMAKNPQSLLDFGVAVDRRCTAMAGHRGSPFTPGNSVSRKSRRRSAPSKIRAQSVRRIQLLVRARLSIPYQSPHDSAPLVRVNKSQPHVAPQSLRRRGEHSVFVAASLATDLHWNLIQYPPLHPVFSPEVSVHREFHCTARLCEIYRDHVPWICGGSSGHDWLIDSRIIRKQHLNGL